MRLRRFLLFALLLAAPARAAEVPLATVASSGTAARSSALTAGLPVSIQCTGPVYLLFGDSAVTVTTSTGVLLPGGALFPTETSSAARYLSVLATSDAGTTTCLVFKRDGDVGSGAAVASGTSSVTGTVGVSGTVTTQQSTCTTPTDKGGLVSTTSTTVPPTQLTGRRLLCIKSSPRNASGTVIKVRLDGTTAVDSLGVPGTDLAPSESVCAYVPDTVAPKAIANVADAGWTSLECAP